MNILLSIVLSVGVFGLCGFVFKMNLIFSVVIAALCYFAFSFLLNKDPKPAPKPLYEPGSQEEMMADAEEDVRTLEKDAARIQGEVSETTASLAKKGNRILAYLQAHPEQISASRKFATYYLDMAGRFADKYADLDETGLKTEEVVNAKKEITKALKLLDNAFDAQYTKLLSGDVMSVEADVKVLQQMVNMEEPGHEIKLKG